MEEQHSYIDLFTLQSRLKAGVEGLFPEAVWVRAEVSAMKVRSTGHCYLELSQSGDGGLVAKANAIVWNSRWRFLAPYFREEAGVPLGEGMQVLVRVQVNYSQLYGFSLIILDIDPSFTVGARELERQRTLDRLQAEGLMDLQKELALPVLPYRLAVISAEGAAGYRDFMRHLHENEKEKGERAAVIEMRTLYAGYFRGVFNFKPKRIKLMSATSLEECVDILRG